jgi:hypothetical protein
LPFELELAGSENRVLLAGLIVGLDEERHRSRGTRNHKISSSGFCHEEFSLIGRERVALQPPAIIHL